jgi:D-threo-aldose 1-dehydrogenase
MDPTATRTIGRTDVAVTQLGFGGASIGELNAVLDERDAVEAVRTAWDAGIRYFDTAPWYGRGLSELRMGSGLRGRPRDEYVLSTKIGRWLRSPERPDTFDGSPWVGGNRMEVVFDYSYDGIMRSYEQSQLRLGLNRYDMAVIHDLDHLYHGSGAKWEWLFGQLASSGWRAVEQLKSSGLLRAAGAGVNHLGLIPRFLDLMPLDFFLIAMPYTLLHQEILDEEFPLAVRHGCSFVIGAPFQSGILATGPTPNAHYNYAPPPPEVSDKVGRIQAVCERHGVPLAAAALQFPLGHPQVASVIPGAAGSAQSRRNVETFSHPIPGELWDELKGEGLLRADAPVPDGAAVAA